jgi:hypothetical protein
MKKSFTFLAVVFLSLSLLGQNPGKSHLQNYYRMHTGKRYEMSQKFQTRKTHFPRTVGQQSNKQQFKSGQKTYKQRLDSTINTTQYSYGGNDYKFVSKEGFLYDANNDDTLYVSVNFKNGKINYGEMTKYAFDAFHNDTLRIGYSMEINADNGTTGNWVPTSKTRTIYAANGSLLQYYIDYHWNKNNWTPVNKYEFFYDVSGHDTMSMEYLWVDSTKKWRENSKNIGFWNDKGIDTLWVGYSWDTASKQWLKVYKTRRTVDENGLTAMYKYYTWVDSTNNWNPNTKYEYSYNPEGKLISRMIYSFDNSTNKWLNFNKKVRAFDQLGNDTSECVYSWDKANNEWAKAYMDKFFYNNSFSYSDLLFPTASYLWPSKVSNHMLTKDIMYQRWDTASNQWQYSDTTSYYYSQQDVTGISPHLIKNNISIYPNPATGFIRFNLNEFTGTASLKIFDILGKEVISGNFTPGERVSVESLKNGIYICKIVFKGKVWVGKFKKE